MTDFPLPPFVDREIWIGFCESRKAARRPFTSFAARRIVHRLTELKGQGFDPNYCLEQSAVKGYLDVYAAEKPKQAPQSEAWKPEEHEWAPPSPEVLAKLKGVLKRVA